MPNVRASSGMMGTTRLPPVAGRAAEPAQQACASAIVVETAWSALRAACASSANTACRAQPQRACARTMRLRQARRRARRRRSSEVVHLVAVPRRDGRTAASSSFVVRDRQLEAVAELLQLLDVELLHLVRDVARLGARRPSVQPFTVFARMTVGLARGARRPSCTRRRPCGSRGRRGAGARAASSRQVLDHLAQPRVRGRRSARGCRRRLSTEYVWHSPSTVVVHRFDQQRRRTSRASSSSHSRPQITLITFQPAPRKTASSSWMILPLPRTGPSRRCRLQLTTKVRLSRLLARRERERAERLGLVHLAVAEERPHAALRRVGDAARRAGSG